MSLLVKREKFLKSLFFYCYLLYNLYGDSMEKMLKSKTFLIMTSILIILLAIGVSIFFIFFSNPKTYKSITYSELEELIDSGDKFILFIGSDSCSHCTIFKVTVDEVVKKHKIVVNYIDVSKLSDSEYAYLNAHLSFSGTPTTVLVNSGNEDVEDRVLTKIKGSKSYSEFTNLLAKYEFIEE